MKNAGSITVSATGDSLFVAKFPKEYEAELKKLQDVFGATDVPVTNLETNVGPFGGFASAYSGGTWLNTTPEAFEDLKRYGFRYYGIANNHTMDYSYHGMLSTIETLKAAGLAFSGSGKSLAEAGAPAELKTPNGTVGIIAVTTSFMLASKAGNPSLGSEARPGVNYVRSNFCYHVSASELSELKAIADKCGINDERNRDIAEGYTIPDPEGVFSLGSANKFTSDPSIPTSSCNAKDLARVTESIRRAKEKYDLVLVLVHSHESGGKKHSDVPEFLRELNRACIDAGAAAVIGGGEHELRPMEIYHGAPIFYSLGDFIYQGMEVEYLPADFMERYGVPDQSTAWEGLMARSKNGKLGLQTFRCNYLTVVPVMQFTEGKLTELSLVPIDLGIEKPGKMNGLPCIASEQVGQEICDILNRLSTPFGTSLTYREGKIVLQ